MREHRSEVRLLERLRGGAEPDLGAPPLYVLSDRYMIELRAAALGLEATESRGRRADRRLIHRLQHAYADLWRDAEVSLKLKYSLIALTTDPLDPGDWAAWAALRRASLPGTAAEAAGVAIQHVGLIVKGARLVQLMESELKSLDRCLPS